MTRSTNRILTTHTGSLPRTPKVVELLLAEGADIRWRLLAILTTSYGAGAFGMLGI